MICRLNVKKTLFSKEMINSYMFLKFYFFKNVTNDILPYSYEKGLVQAI